MPPWIIIIRGTFEELKKGEFLLEFTLYVLKFRQFISTFQALWLVSLSYLILAIPNLPLDHELSLRLKDLLTA